MYRNVVMFSDITNSSQLSAVAKSVMLPSKAWGKPPSTPHALAAITRANLLACSVTRGAVADPRRAV